MLAERAIEGLAKSFGQELDGFIDLAWVDRLRACHRYFAMMLELNAQVAPPEPPKFAEDVAQERLVRGLVRFFVQCVADEGDIAAGEAGA